MYYRYRLRLADAQESEVSNFIEDGKKM